MVQRNTIFSYEITIEAGKKGEMLPFFFYLSVSLHKYGKMERFLDK